eukprot:TRINITY_DN2490_c0_g1_i5.p1 TRINITY_DN2490_c0_g1~~TRINITY_DN2490_c0_g1_i5.p1  ORF type:complete len:404 (-),score=83.69 TRINITY_DN2490_c0_g1_i5:130-1341(-)
MNIHFLFLVCFSVSLLLSVCFCDGTARLKSSSKAPPTVMGPRVNNSLQDSCYCAGGSVQLWNYETMPLSNTGAGCIGGCGGGPFTIHEYSIPVQELNVWVDGDDFQAMSVKFFNGNRYTVGSIPARGPNQSIVFALGETIVGTMELCGNGHGSRTGYMDFKTSKGQEFKVGNEHTPYYFDSGNSFLVGFFGQSGDQIDQLGFLMMKAVSDVQMLNVQYPTLNTYTSGLVPQIYKAALCNDDPSQPQTQTATFSKTVGSQWSFSMTFSLSFGFSFSVEGGLPGVVKETTGFSWQVGISSTYSLQENTAATKTMEFPVTVPPRSRIFATFSWWDSRCDVPYTADLQYTFKDNSVVTFSYSDVYNGAYITDATSDYHTVPLNSTESCAHSNKYHKPSKVTYPLSIN